MKSIWRNDGRGAPANTAQRQIVEKGQDSDQSSINTLAEEVTGAVCAALNIHTSHKLTVNWDQMAKRKVLGSNFIKFHLFIDNNQWAAEGLPGGGFKLRGIYRVDISQH